MTARLVAALALAPILFAVQGESQNATPAFTAIYNFQPAADGSMPYGALSRDAKAILYGVTSSGGSGYGTVYSLTPPASPGGAWAEAVLYSFPGGRDGSSPEAGVSIGKDGALYGTTAGGGGNPCVCGTVFRLAPPLTSGGDWTHTVLHSFAGDSDGSHPTGTLALGAHAEIYGTTEHGGADSSGVVFELTPPGASGESWTESIVHVFTDSRGDGLGPNHGVSMGSDGSLYGTTLFGGTSKGGCNGGCGIVFQLTPPSSPGGAWMETVLHNFTGADDGGYPGAFVMGGNGNLYGATAVGGSVGAGVVYELTPPVSAGSWTETILYSFTIAKRVPSVVTSLAVGGSGDVFATTLLGGKNRGGALLKLAPPATSGGPWQETIVHRFARPLDPAHRNRPQGLLFAGDGDLLGITTYGGSGACESQGVMVGCGTVFELKP